MEIDVEDGRRICNLTAGSTLEMQLTSALRTSPDRIVISGQLDKTSGSLDAILNANRTGIEVLLKPA